MGRKITSQQRTNIHNSSQPNTKDGFNFDVFISEEVCEVSDLFKNSLPEALQR